MKHHFDEEFTYWVTHLSNITNLPLADVRLYLQTYFKVASAAMKAGYSVRLKNKFGVFEANKIAFDRKAEWKAKAQFLKLDARKLIEQFPDERIPMEHLENLKQQHNLNSLSLIYSVISQLRYEQSKHKRVDPGA